MSSNNKTIGLVLAIMGLVVAIIGAALYILETLNLIPGVLIIILGISILLAGVLIMYEIVKLGGQGENKKAPKAPKAAAAPKEKAKAKSSCSGKSRADSVNLGGSELAKAMKYAAEKLDGKVAGGRIPDAQADIYMDKIMSFAPQVGKDEDAALVGLSQLIGAIVEA